MYRENYRAAVAAHGQGADATRAAADDVAVMLRRQGRTSAADQFLREAGEPPPQPRSAGNTAVVANDAGASSSSSSSSSWLSMFQCTGQDPDSAAEAGCTVLLFAMTKGRDRDDNGEIGGLFDDDDNDDEFKTGPFARGGGGGDDDERGLQAELDAARAETAVLREQLFAEQRRSSDRNRQLQTFDLRNTGR